MNKLSNYFTNAVKNYALKNWRLYTFKQEWFHIIVLVFVTKIATSVVSIFSGFYYLENVFYGLFSDGKMSSVCSVVALVLIELLSALFLSKFFKFVLRFNNFKWVFPLVLSVGVFGLSFITSTNGIAIYTAGKVDLSKNIEDKYLTEIETIKTDYLTNTSIIKEHINDIKNNPTEWKDGKRCVLSKQQLDEIKECYNNITSLTNDRDQRIKSINETKLHELSQNKTASENEAAKYYKYVAVIMLIQFVTSLALWFFWCKISNEDDPESNQLEAVERGLLQIENTVDGCINARVDTKLNILKTIYNEIATEKDRRKVAAIRQNSTPKQPKIVGFSTPKRPEIETENNAATLGVSNVNNVNKMAVNAVNVCVECGSQLTPSQVVRHAKFCCPKCRVNNYNKTHPTRKQIVISETNLKH